MELILIHRDMRERLAVRKEYLKRDWNMWSNVNVL